ncbi:MAG: hypothetical protein R2856_25860 [Caldilineaceae bacterium]
MRNRRPQVYAVTTDPSILPPPALHPLVDAVIRLFQWLGQRTAGAAGYVAALLQRLRLRGTGRRSCGRLDTAHRRDDLAGNALSRRSYRYTGAALG